MAVPRRGASQACGEYENGRELRFLQRDQSEAEVLWFVRIVRADSRGTGKARRPARRVLGSRGKGGQAGNGWLADVRWRAVREQPGLGARPDGRLDSPVGMHWAAGCEAPRNWEAENSGVVARGE